MLYATKKAALVAMATTVIFGPVGSMAEADTTAAAWAKQAGEIIKDKGAVGTVMKGYDASMRELLVGKKEKILAFVNDNVQLINDFAEVVPQLWDDYIAKDLRNPKSKNPFKADGGFYSVPKEDNLDMAVQSGVPNPRHAQTLVQGATHKYVLHLKGFGANGITLRNDFPDVENYLKMLGNVIKELEKDNTNYNPEEWSKYVAAACWDGDEVEYNYFSQFLPAVGDVIGHARMRRSRATINDEFADKVLKGVILERTDNEKVKALRTKLDAESGEEGKDPNDDYYKLIADAVGWQVFFKNDGQNLQSRFFFDAPPTPLMMGSAMGKPDGLKKDKPRKKEFTWNLEAFMNGKKEFSWDKSKNPTDWNFGRDFFPVTEFFYKPARSYTANDDGDIDESYPQIDGAMVTQGWDLEGDAIAPAMAWEASEARTDHEHTSAKENPAIEYGVQIFKSHQAEFPPSNGFTHVIVHLGGGPTVATEYAGLAMSPWFSGPLHVFVANSQRLQYNNIKKEDMKEAEIAVGTVVGGVPGSAPAGWGYEATAWCALTGDPDTSSQVSEKELEKRAEQTKAIQKMVTKQGQLDMKNVEYNYGRYKLVRPHETAEGRTSMFYTEEPQTNTDTPVPVAHLFVSKDFTGGVVSNSKEDDNSMCTCIVVILVIVGAVLLIFMVVVVVWMARRGDEHEEAEEESESSS